jgi:putative endonuclease
MKDYYYVYTLQSIAFPNEHYTGFTSDLKQRLAEHNAGKVLHTSKFVPWEIRSATAFKSKTCAMAFERYLKTGSGRAFLKRHL